MRSKLVIGLVLAGCVLTSWLITFIYGEAHKRLNEGTIMHSEVSWFFQLQLNLVGYATILLPGFILYKYLQRTGYFEKLGSPTGLSRALWACFGPGSTLPDVKREGSTPHTGQGAELALCCSGLMGAYLVWGLLQEKIMTQNYVMSDGSLRKFSDSQFLVFINRLSALAAAGARLACSAGAGPGHAPLYAYSYCSLTNVVSAWCQYEALKYVSFPTQVLSKSCKVLPVMLMGRLVSGSQYGLHEYVTAAGISAGMVLFLTGADHQHASSSLMTASGVALLTLYMACDSFTSSWQGRLFRTYHVSPVQMMFGVNLFSCLLTGASLAQHPSTWDSLALLQHPVFVSDCVLLSASSALGQLLIYRTISSFGPVVFTIIMTLRQAVSVLLSCVVYGHRVSWSGVAGVALVFGCVLLRLYCRHRSAAQRRALV